MKLEVPVFSQRDPKWAKKKLGNSNLEFGLYGCAVTAMAMLCCYYGKDTDPGKLNDDLKEKDGFIEGNIIWSAVHKVYPDIKFTSWKDYPLEPAPVNAISDRIKWGHPVVCWVDINPNQPGNQMHWVLLIGIEGDDFWLNDPWYGDQVLFSKRYGVPKIGILGHRFFSGPVPEDLGEEKKYSEAEMSQMRKERDDNWNLAMQYKREKEGLEVRVKDLEKRIGDLEAKIGDYINSLADQLKCEADESAIKEKIEVLLAIEDQKIAVEGKLTEAQKQLDSLNKELQITKENLSKSTKQYNICTQELKRALAGCSEVEALKKRIAALEKKQDINDFDSIELLKEVLRRIFRRNIK